MADRIPITTAERIGKKHGYDQVIIVARRIGDQGVEWCTTWGKDRRNCDAAARIGDAIRDNVTPTIERLTKRAVDAEADRDALLHGATQGTAAGIFAEAGGAGPALNAEYARPLRIGIAGDTIAFHAADAATDNRGLTQTWMAFLDSRVDEWMADTEVQRMFNAIASVFEKWAPQDLMDRFREQLGAIGKQCFLEGALRAGSEIAAARAAAAGKASKDDLLSDELVPAYTDHALVSAARFERDLRRAAIIRAERAEAKLAEARKGPWLIFYEDADVRPEIFMGEGAEIAARARYADAVTNWSCHLFFAFPHDHVAPPPFQARVDEWMQVCFGAEIAADITERCDRFIEEALELAQANGWTANRAHALVDYVYGRDQGEINQETGGVMVTLAALCNATGVDIEHAAETELARIWTKVEAIRAKQAAKPTGSALPVAVAPAVRVEHAPIVDDVGGGP